MLITRLSMAAFAATGLSMALGSAPALAQYADDPPNAYDRPAPAYYPPAPAYAEPGSNVGDVVVVAPYRRSERDPATGAPVERVWTSRIVRYDDLDLTTDRGVRALHFRVLRAARDACDSLERHYAVSDAGDSDCVPTAVRNAMRQAPIGDATDAAYEGP